jgi:hypothetical protein
MSVGRCRECGRELHASRAAFCETACRRAFNNRKASRGAQLYDLIMALRLDRNAAAEAGVFFLICRMIKKFANEDALAGRCSWDAPFLVRARNSHLAATVVGINVAGAKGVRDAR